MQRNTLHLTTFRLLVCLTFTIGAYAGYDSLRNVSVSVSPDQRLPTLDGIS